jgi:hypothetical protein
MVASKVNALLLVLSITLALRGVEVVAAAAYPLGPNRFLGTCLDSPWVAQQEAARGISSKARDSNGRLLHPFLQPALKYPRYTVRQLPRAR